MAQPNGLEPSGASLETIRAADIAISIKDFVYAAKSSGQFRWETANAMTLRVT